MDENGRKGILEMGSQSGGTRGDQEKKKLLCLWLKVRNYTYE